MESLRGRVVIIADAPGARSPICGISMLERLLRNLQRLDYTEAVILSSLGDSLNQELARPSWPRARMVVDLRSAQSSSVTVADLRAAACDDAPFLVLDGSSYCDPRLIRTLRGETRATALVDTSPPTDLLPLLENSKQTTVHSCDAFLVTSDWMENKAADQPLLELLRSETRNGSLHALDVAAQDDYVVGMRRHIRPLWFPAPAPEQVRLAGRLILNTAQNGTLDAPALVHAPIETWIVARIARTNITPNQITFVTMLMGIAVTLLFLTGNLWLGLLLALVIGVLDGVDGKLARTKVETSEFGKLEHEIDYAVEMSWWIALAHHLAASEKLPAAYYWWLLFIGSDLLDRLAKMLVKRKLGRNLDDVAPIDRAVRFVGGRRNIYVWIMAAGLILGQATNAYVAVCCWSAMTAAIHLIRAAQIRLR